MGKNPNNHTVYIRDANLELWKSIGNSFRSDFVNWALRNYLDDYNKQAAKIAEKNRKALSK